MVLLWLSMWQCSSPLLFFFWLQFGAFLLLPSEPMLFREELVASPVFLALALVAFPDSSVSLVLVLVASPDSSVSLVPVLVASPASLALALVASLDTSVSLVLVLVDSSASLALALSDPAPLGA